jgi:hypothetical protein
MEAKLLVVGGEVKTKEVRLRLPSVIGRGRGSNIVLPHPLVSRKHCELCLVGDKIVVRDLGSLNGTYVNNERIADEMTIEPGQLLTIGSVTFRVLYGVGVKSGSAELETEDWAPADSGDEQSPALTENLDEELAAQAAELGGATRASTEDEPSVPSMTSPFFSEQSGQENSNKDSGEGIIDAGSQKEGKSDDDGFDDFLRSVGNSK